MPINFTETTGDREAKNLKNDTDQMEMFMKMPFPFDFKVYFFNIENPDEVLIGAKPKLKEIGPYIYNLYRWKTNVEWNSTSDEISYNGYERYEFDKDRSRPLSEEDVVTIINTPLNSFLMTAEEISPNALPTINDALPTIFGENSGIFLKTKVKDYLFDGIKICKDKGVTGGFASKLICSQIISKLNTTKAMTLWENSVLFANLRYKNNTSPGRETIHSGSNIKDETAELIRFKGNSYIKSWQENSKCNKIRGKTTVFPANIKTKFKFKSFSLDICR
ncbi:unnamed protein product [Brassicogethes aeneus]|uniref:Sensory neuron membrane protein 2 n=1 Tax=Brassicogethes aeneus TaxID=1431903 RepID=A0A9P0FC23_BRAAE|nr:unnamed protein product [Brassicogethes aeneus]